MIHGSRRFGKLLMRILRNELYISKILLFILLLLIIPSIPVLNHSNNYYLNYNVNKTNKVTDQDPNNLQLSQESFHGRAIWKLCKDCTGQVSTTKFSPDMKLIAAGDENGQIFVWDIQTGKKLYQFQNSNSVITNFVWTSDSKILISIYRESILSYWNISDGQMETHHFGNIGNILTFDMTSDSNKLIIVSDDEKLSLWNLDGTFISFLSENIGSYPLDIKISPDNSLVAVFTTSGAILTWKLLTSDLLFSLLLGTPNSAIFKGNSLAFSSNSSLIFVTCLMNGGLKIIDISKGKTKNELFPGILISSISNAKLLNIVALDFFDFQNYGLKLYDYEKNSILMEIGEIASFVDISKDASMTVSIGLTHIVNVWSTIKGSELYSLSAHNDKIIQTRYLSTDSSIFVTASYDNTVKIWKDNKINQTIELNERPSSVAITKKNNDLLVAIGTDFGKVFLYNASNGGALIYYGTHPTSPSSNIGARVYFVDFSPDGTYFLSTPWYSNYLYIWNSSYPELINSFLVSNSGNFINNMYFLTNSTIIGPISGYPPFVVLDIFTGDVVKTYDVQGDYYVSSFSISDDHSLIAASLHTTGAFTIINLTTGEYKMVKIPFLSSATYYGAPFFGSRFTPDNKYVIGVVPGDYKIFFVNLKNLNVQYSTYLDIPYPSKFDFSNTNWTLLYGKETNNEVAILDLSPLKEGNFNQLDFDGDGMNDTWEQKYSLEEFNYYDRFQDPDNDSLFNWEEFNYNTNPRSIDTDNDTITDTYEVKYGLNPNVDDSLLDIDNDGMNNLYEFKMGLDSSVNDSFYDYDNDGLTNLQEFYYQTDVHNPDTDFDGMPDKWEVDNHLNPLDSSDASKDNDFDGISNLNEFKAGSDPNNFFIVPLFSINNFYIGLSILGLSIVIFGYIEYRRWLTNQFLAPDYSVTKKVKKSGLESWYEFTSKEKELDQQLQKAKSFLLEGLIDRSVTLYYSLVDNLKLLSKDVETAETLVRILFISQKLEKTMPLDYRLIHEKFPLKSRNVLIKSYNHILQAFEYESKNNTGLALELLNNVYSSNILPPEISLLTLYCVIDVMIDQTQLNKSDEFFNSIQRKLVSFKSQAEKLGLFEYVCGAYILHARLLFYKYRLDEATNYLDKVKELATTKHIYYFIDKATTEIESFNKLKDNIKINLSLTDESTLTLERNFEEYQKQILDYALRAKALIEKDEN